MARPQDVMVSRPSFQPRPFLRDINKRIPAKGAGLRFYLAHSRVANALTHQENNVAMNKILVIGTSGLVWRRVARVLLEDG
jgi:hypothetical protein